MTYKPKRNPEIDTYKNNPEKFSSNGKNKLPESETEYFLKHGEMIDGTKRELSDILELQKSKNPNISKKGKIRYNELNDPGSEVILKKQFLDINNLSYNKIDDFQKFGYNEVKKYFDKLQEVFGDIGIKISKEVMDLKLFIYINDDKIRVPGLSNQFFRTIILDKYSDAHIIFHEFIHHICESYFNSLGMVNGYIFGDSDFINESMTDIITYQIEKKYKGNKHKISVESLYTNNVKLIAKLIDLATEKLNKSPEYIYNYMTRGYVIKGYKGLNLFYEAFGKNFLKGLMKLGTDKSDEVKFIELVKNNYDKLGFSTQEKAVDYFDPNDKPSQEIGDIMGIER